MRFVIGKHTYTWVFLIFLTATIWIFKGKWNEADHVTSLKIMQVRQSDNSQSVINPRARHSQLTLQCDKKAIVWFGPPPAMMPNLIINSNSAVSWSYFSLKLNISRRIFWYFSVSHLVSGFCHSCCDICVHLFCVVENDLFGLYQGWPTCSMCAVSGAWTLSEW